MQQFTFIQNSEIVGQFSHVLSADDLFYLIKGCLLLIKIKKKIAFMNPKFPKKRKKTYRSEKNDNR